MKLIPNTCLCLMVGILSQTILPVAIADDFNFTGINKIVPDDDASGLSDSRNLTSISGALTDVTLSLVLAGAGIDGGFNGDLFAMVEHDGMSVTLLNRPGRTSANPYGYADNGMSVTFGDSAAQDIHLYQNTVSVAVGSPLTGTWRPDGRGTDPASVLDTDPQKSRLSDFTGKNAAGEWVLFIADLDAGSQVQLQSWSLSLKTQSVVPESKAYSTVFGCILLGLGLWRAVPKQRSPRLV